MNEFYAQPSLFFGSYNNIIDLIYKHLRHLPRFVPLVYDNDSNVNTWFNSDVIELPSSHKLYGRRFIKRIGFYTDYYKNKGRVRSFDIMYKHYGFIDKKAIYIKSNIMGGPFSMELHGEWESFDLEIRHPQNTISISRYEEICNNYTI